MSSPNPTPSDRDIRTLDWEDQDDRNWTATAPGGWAMFYAGERFNPLRRGYSRWTNLLTLTRRGKAPAGLLPEGGFDQVAKRIGYAIELQTGDAAFDRRIYLATDNADLVRALAERPETRQAVLNLFDLEVARIDITAHGFTARLGEAAHPDQDSGVALSNLALHLCALSDLWPDAPPPGSPNANGGLSLRGLSFAWFCIVAATTFCCWAFGGERAVIRQIETFAETDWLGMGLLFMVGVAPYALLGGRRATSHKVLVAITLAMLALLPISDRLLQIDMNRLRVRSQALAPAIPTALRPDPARLYSHGYLLDVTIEDRPLDWALSLDEGKLAVEGRLCLAGVVAEGLRGLRYVKAVRTWTCRPGETSRVPPPSPLPTPDDVES
jgi:hypothetical protein